AQNKIDEALKYYNESLEFCKKLVADFPQNPLYRRDLQYVQRKIDALKPTPSDADVLAQLKKLLGG
ncbi:MAG: hypothetical protein IKM24_00790, partial [Clostridia bacterium]|nr:hypothetical protein [Clostridia bacterium]